MSCGLAFDAYNLKISSVHNGNNKRAYSIFHPLRVSSEEKFYYELLQSGETITADRYQQQLTNLSDELEEERPFTGQGSRKVILLHDNARPHIAKATQDHIFALGWELLPHAAYSPDMAPSDYHLFGSLQHHLADTHFVEIEEIRKCIDDFIALKPVNFYRQGIHNLPERWQ
jgi:[histone H3]-lysine36 N-dimethyltransferase SETMAR